MNLTRIYFLFLVLFLGGCKSENRPKDLGRAVYFWKTNFELSKKEKAFLEENKIEKIYLRFFDVDMLQNEAIPKGIVSIRTKVNQEIVPTVFITNRVFERLKFEQIEDLSANVLGQINKISNAHKEIQFDCDWTLSTKSKYFFFLEKINEKSPKDMKYSATIRLHQIKFYKKTGIPPVDEGVLMLYNTGDWRKLTLENSLFDAQTTMNYLDNLSEYPLNLNFAFTFFQQVLAYRNGIFYTFIKNCTLSEIEANAAFEKTKTENQFLCKKDVQFKNISFRENDILKFENSEFEKVNKTKNRILQKTKALKTTIILYHLDEKSLSNYNQEQIQEFFSQN
ncbi:hypothetical protein [Lacihabitans soyangensis]|uniref:Lipoprotein n=1 Tax=Lacihabitans soyangensis TaxID=869394 RepID=A0AAE3KRV4_9BACT|nr:hypothetical protein [Lacihabitans soyangensis]MCP9761904.1 hypothetical protein [Lacihabitans soyangensis]